MNNLMQASNELFRRHHDERFPSLDALRKHCQHHKDISRTHMLEAHNLNPSLDTGVLGLRIAQENSFSFNDWSFTQACTLARVSKDTLNRLSPDTARKALQECMPRGNTPMQVYTANGGIRAINGPRYQRLHNAELVDLAIEFGTDFQPPQSGIGGASGLYCGEQDMFMFLIDPTGWIDIEGEAFAPGFFLWNSEVGRRTVGIQTFWFQAVCQNHIVWDAIDVTEFSRKHIGNVGDALNEIARLIETLVQRRDERRDAFVQVIRRAMQEKLGSADEDALNLLLKHGFKQELAQKALLLAREHGKLTVFSLVDALTRIAGESKNAGDRLELDVKASKLLEAVAA